VVGLDAEISVLPHPRRGGPGLAVVAAPASAPYRGRTRMNRRLLLALVLPPLVAAAVFTEVAVNRVDSVGPIGLSERELSLLPRSGDNSVATMVLQWQQRTSRNGGFDCVKLQALGMDCAVSPTSSDAPRHYGRMLPRRAFVAFELSGPAWEQLIS